MRKLVLYFALLLAVPCSAQSYWSGILSNSRATSWQSQVGLPASYSDGETTTNAWTPPVRTQCGSTISASGDTSGATDTSAINTALGSCATGHYVLLASGTFYITTVNLYQYSGVSVRGGGPQSTLVHAVCASSCLNGAFDTDWAANTGSCTTWNSGFSSGTTSISLSGCTGTTPHAGMIIQMTQCDTGTSGSNCGTGTVTDNNGLFMCGYNTVCQRSGEGTGTGQHWQNQTSYVTAVSGSAGSYTFTISPGLMLSNWSSADSPTISWEMGNSSTNNPYGIGVEDMTIIGTPASYALVALGYCYGCWGKGLRLIGHGTGGGATAFLLDGATNSLVMNDYTWGQVPPPGSSYNQALQTNLSSNNLILNNVYDESQPWVGYGSNSGNVWAYNFAHNSFTSYVLSFFEHQAGSTYELFEGNDIPNFEEDDTHGTHDLNTWFRNYQVTWDQPYLSTNESGFLFDDFARFENAIGNIIGTSSSLTGTYQGNGSTDQGWIYELGHGQFGDQLAQTTAMRWMNYDVATAAIRQCGNSSNTGWSTTCGGGSATITSCSDSSTTVTCTYTGSLTLTAGQSVVSITGNSVSAYNSSWRVVAPTAGQFTFTEFTGGNGTGTGGTVVTGSEVPTNLGTNSAYNNSVPSSTTLPVSFFLPTTAHPSGGTGLSWWKVCTTWATFPTSCSGTQTQPFPPVGPDVTGGDGTGGYAYSPPSRLAWLNLPVDSSMQTSYTITASSWTGQVETLTITGLPNIENLMGAFQLSGVNAACLTGATFGNNSEIQMTGSSSTQVTYALPSNPDVNCTGTMLFPDVRQFDERVYESDPATSTAAPVMNGPIVLTGPFTVN
jgi:hypothetical protein